MGRNSDLKSVPEDKDGSEECLFANTISSVLHSLLHQRPRVFFLVCQISRNTFVTPSKSNARECARRSATVPQHSEELVSGSFIIRAHTNDMRLLSLLVHLHSSDAIKNTSSYHKLWLASTTRTLGNICLGG